MHSDESSSQFPVGSWVCLRDDEQVFLPARVLAEFSRGGEGVVETEDGIKHTLSESDTKKLKLLDAQVLDPSIQDVLALSTLNDFTFMHNLRIRFKNDSIYTLVGPDKHSVSSRRNSIGTDRTYSVGASTVILICVNPFRTIPQFYDSNAVQPYLTRGASRFNNKPHIFMVCQRAYSSLIKHNVPQSMLISGMSGAGKTEATKQVLSFLATASAKSSSAGKLTKQLLQANPLIEAFANAKTNHNDNSSRFGKLITVEITAEGAIKSGHFSVFMLEKCRVITQTAGECNYHICYQLLACSQSKVIEVTKLEARKAYKSVSAPGSFQPPPFTQTVNAANEMGVSMDQQAEMWQLVAATIHLCDVSFVIGADGEKADVDAADQSSFETASMLLGVAATSLERIICQHLFQGTTGSVIFLNHDVEQSANARDSLCRGLYAHIFQYIITRINSELGQASTSSCSCPIHLLDIFGFECFEHNSFEQLCINYCNEKLQAHFNSYVFEMEAAEYRDEGIDITNHVAADISGPQKCVALIDHSRSGILALLQDEMLVPGGSDEGFLRKVTQQHSDHPCILSGETQLNSAAFKAASSILKTVRRAGLAAEKETAKLGVISAFKSNAKPLRLQITHFAAPVQYDVRGFLEKSQDRIRQDALDLFRTSTVGLLCELQKAMASELGEGGAPKKNATSLGMQFKAQLSDLMATIVETTPHFVRCIKSNFEKRAKTFDAHLVLDQLRTSGLLEVCRIRQDYGYPVRMKFAPFYRRFRLLRAKHNGRRLSALGSSFRKGSPTHATDATSVKSIQDLVDSLRDKGLVSDAPGRQVAIGSTQIFMKQELSDVLEDERYRHVDEATHTIGRSMPMLYTRYNYNRNRRVLCNLRLAVQQQNIDKLDSLLASAAETLPHRGTHLPEVKDARALLTKASDWSIAYEMARSGSTEQLETLISKKSRDKSFAQIVQKAKKFVSEVQAATETLQEALDSDSAQTLKRALKKAEGFGLQSSDVRRAEEMIEQLGWQKADKGKPNGSTSKESPARATARVTAKRTQGQRKGRGTFAFSDYDDSSEDEDSVGFMPRLASERRRLQENKEAHVSSIMKSADIGTRHSDAVMNVAKLVHEANERAEGSALKPGRKQSTKPGMRKASSTSAIGRGRKQSTAIGRGRKASAPHISKSRSANTNRRKTCANVSFGEAYSGRESTAASVLHMAGDLKETYELDEQKNPMLPPQARFQV